jgi:hypothetical protein
MLGSLPRVDLLRASVVPPSRNERTAGPFGRLYRLSLLAWCRQPLAVALSVRSAEAGSEVGGRSVGRGPSSITLQSRNNVATLRLDSASALGFAAPG